MVRAQRSLFAVWALVCLSGTTMAVKCREVSVIGEQISINGDWWVAARHSSNTYGNKCVKVNVKSRQNLKDFDISTFKFENNTLMIPEVKNYTVIEDSTSFRNGYKVYSVGAADVTYKLLKSTGDYALFCSYMSLSASDTSNFGLILIRDPTVNFEQAKTDGKTIAELTEFKDVLTGCIPAPSGTADTLAPVVVLLTTAMFGLLKFSQLF